MEAYDNGWNNESQTDSVRIDCLQRVNGNVFLWLDKSKVRWIGVIIV